jgi:hypothetical protein
MADDWQPVQKDDWAPVGPQGFTANAMDFVKSIPGGLLKGFTGGVNSNPALMQDEQMAEQQARQATAETVANQIHKPEGGVGKIGSAIGEGLGNPISWVGPGGAALKGVGAVLSSGGGEAARQTAEGTAFEKPAQLAGGLAGGMAAVKVAGVKAPKAKTPDYRELKDAATRDYTEARNTGYALDPQGAESFGSRLKQELAGPNHGFVGGANGDARKTFAFLDDVHKPFDPSNPVGKTPRTIDQSGADVVRPLTASDIDAKRKFLARLARETVEGKPTPDAAAATVALGYFNKYLENPPKNHVVAGSAEDYVRATRRGNANYAAAQKLRVVDQKVANAQRNTEGSIAASLDNQIKSQIRNGILNRPQAQRGWSPEALAQANKVNSGTVTSNILRNMGRGGSGVIPIMAQAAAAPGVAALGGPVGLALQGGLAAILYGSKKTAERMTLKEAKKLAEMLAQDSPEYQSRVANLPPTDLTPNKAALIRALLGQQ